MKSKTVLIVAITVLIVIAVLYFGGALFGGALLPLLIALVTIWTENHQRWAQASLTALVAIVFVVALLGALRARHIQDELETRNEELESLGGHLNER